MRSEIARPVVAVAPETGRRLEQIREARPFQHAFGLQASGVEGRTFIDAENPKELPDPLLLPKYLEALAKEPAAASS